MARMAATPIADFSTSALFVGAASCRERGAQRPQGFSIDADIAGAASQPFRDTRPLLQRTARVSEIFWKAGAVTRQAFLPRHAQDLWERPCVAKGPQSGPRILALHQLVLGLLCSPFAAQGRSYKGPRKATDCVSRKITLSAAHRSASATRQSRYLHKSRPLSALQASLPVRPGRCRCG